VLSLFRKIPKNLLFLVFGVIIGVVLGAYSNILSNELGNNAPSILKVLGDADAVLIGFLGVITVFILTSYRDESHYIDEKVRRLEGSHRRYERLHGRDDVSCQEYSDDILALNDHRKFVRNAAKECCYAAFLGVIFFIISILFCLLSMSELSYKAIWLGIATIGMAYGLICIFYEIAEFRSILT